MTKVTKLRLIGRVLLPALILSVVVWNVAPASAAAPNTDGYSQPWLPPSTTGRSCVTALVDSETHSWAAKTNTHIWIACYYLDIVNHYETPPSSFGHGTPYTSCSWSTTSWGSTSSFGCTSFRFTEFTETHYVEYGDGSGFVQAHFKIQKTNGSSDTTLDEVGPIHWGPAGEVSCAPTQCFEMGDNSPGTPADSVSVSASIRSPWSQWGDAWPEYNFGTAFGSGPPNPCLAYDVTFDSYDSSADEWSAHVGINGVIIADNDRVRVTINDTDATFPLEVTTWYARFNDSMSYEPIIGTSTLTVALPVYGDLVRSGSSVDLSDFQMFCRPANGSDQWFYPGIGFDSDPPDDTTTCSAYTFGLRVSHDGGATYEDLTSTDVGFVQSDDWVEVTTYLAAGRTAEAATIGFLPSPGASWLEVHQVASPTLFPLSTVFQLAEPAQLLDSAVSCIGADGTTTYSGPNGEPTATASEESCYDQSGMSLTSPSTWVRGIGRMASCVVQFLVVPDVDTLDETIGTASSDLEEQFPFSAGYMAADFYDEAANTIGTSTGCIDLDIDPGGVDTGCIDMAGGSVTGPGTPARAFLVIFTVGAQIVSLVIVSINLVRT